MVKIGLKSVNFSKVIPDLDLERTAKQVKDHYVNYLRPDINKDPWTLEDDLLLIELLRSYGKNWKLIEDRMGGRTQNQIKNRYFRRLKLL